MTATRPAQEFYSIGEVCALTDLAARPALLGKPVPVPESGEEPVRQPRYKNREVELIMLVKHLLYTEKFTIEGARQRLDQYRRTGELRTSARRAVVGAITELRVAVEDVLEMLDGKAPHAR